MSHKYKNLGGVLFKAYRAFIRIKCSTHKREKVSVNVSPLLRATAGDSLLAEGGELYKEAKLRVSRAWQYATPHAFACMALAVLLWNTDSAPPALKTTCHCPVRLVGLVL